MSQMRVPVTDAFAETDQLRSVEVELPPRQIEWLKRQADERSLSVDHVLRALITAQIRGTDPEFGSPASSGDGALPSADSTVERTDATTNGDEESGPTSIVESLRSASERLQALTDEEDDSTGPDLSDTLARLKTRREASDPDAAEKEDDAVVLDDRRPSMFDLVEDGE